MQILPPIKQLNNSTPKQLNFKQFNQLNILIYNPVLAFNCLSTMAKPSLKECGL